MHERGGMGWVRVTWWATGPLWVRLRTQVAWSLPEWGNGWLWHCTRSWEVTGKTDGCWTRRLRGHTEGFGMGCHWKFKQKTRGKISMARPALLPLACLSLPLSSSFLAVVASCSEELLKVSYTLCSALPDEAFCVLSAHLSNCAVVCCFAFALFTSHLREEMGLLYFFVANTSHMPNL